jgi:hypothetical protein
MDLNKELRERLREKRQEIYNKNHPMSLKEKRKLDKQVDKDKKEMMSDTRVTPLMRNWFLSAMASSMKIDVNTPSFILNNLDESKLKFYKFITKYIAEIKLDIDVWKNDMLKGLDKIQTKSEKDEYLRNIDAEYKKKFKNYFTTPYVTYMSLMTGINVYEDLMFI